MNKSLFQNQVMDKAPPIGTVNSDDVIKAVEKQIMMYVDQYPKQGFLFAKKYFDLKQQKMTEMKMQFEKVTGVSPVALLNQAMVKYQQELRGISKMANEFLQFTPPDNLETPIFKFLGLNKDDEPKRKLFEPISSKFVESI